MLQITIAVYFIRANFITIVNKEAYVCLKSNKHLNSMNLAQCSTSISRLFERNHVCQERKQEWKKKKKKERCLVLSNVSVNHDILVTLRIRKVNMNDIQQQWLHRAKKCHIWTASINKSNVLWHMQTRNLQLKEAVLAFTK